MGMRSALAGSAATLVVVAGAVFAISASNAAEPAGPVPAAVVGHYSTVEVQDPIEYVPAPVEAPAPVVAEPVTPEVVVPESAPEATVEPPATDPAKPSSDSTLPPTTVEGDTNGGANGDPGNAGSEN